MSEPKRPRCWVITELYYPEDGATGHLLTQIAEGIAAIETGESAADISDSGTVQQLAEHHDVHVICAQPAYTKRRGKSPRFEIHNGVHIHRARSTSFSKDRLPLRMINVLTILTSFFWNMLWRFRRGDSVLVVTNPPPLPFAARIAAQIRGCKTVLLIHDIYPDVLVPAGFTKYNSFIYRIINWCCVRLYRRVDRVITIGRDMQRRVTAKDKRIEGKAVFIPNWADSETIHPIPDSENTIRPELDFADKFIIQYSGNIGRTHDMLTIARAAERLEADGFDGVHWMICGIGGGRAKLESAISEKGLKTVSVFDPFPRERIVHLINCADVSIISFIEGMSGISVPSRLYNILAAGSPVIGVTEDDSELALTITENEIGWVVPPGDDQALADTVRQIYANRQSLGNKSAVCRKLATEKYTVGNSIKAYAEVLFGP